MSLLEEKLPAYTLRQDALSQFSGAANADWVLVTPSLPADRAGA